MADWLINRDAKMIASSLSLGVAEQVRDGMREGAVPKNEFVREVLCYHAEKGSGSGPFDTSGFALAMLNR